MLLAWGLAQTLRAIHSGPLSLGAADHLSELPAKEAEREAVGKKAHVKQLKTLT